MCKSNKNFGLHKSFGPGTGKSCVNGAGVGKSCVNEVDKSCGLDKSSVNEK